MEDREAGMEKIPGKQKNNSTILTPDSQDGAAPFKREGLFVIEAVCFGKMLKVSGFERTVGEEKPVKSYKEIPFNEKRVKQYTKDTIDLLNRANRRGKINKDLLVKLRELGRLMFDELIPVTVKNQFNHTAAKNLMISIDDKLVFIPWELLFDGKEFLCQKFSVGRSVSTKQQVSSVTRNLGSQLTMHILADPGSDLKAAYEEGVAIKKELGTAEDLIDVSLKSSDIRTDYVKAKIRSFDMVHYAGHAEHNSKEPEKSGWVLKDGKLHAQEIMSLAGAVPMPSLVFSNACRSGQTEEWRIEEDYEDRIFGLANAFLLAGVQHYIGTFWEIPDEAGSYYAVSFYKNILNGVSVGEAMRRARKALISKYGEDTIVWASYMLYGDPTTVYIQTGRKDIAGEPEWTSAREELVSSGLRHREEVIQLKGGKKQQGQKVVVGIAILAAIVICLFYIRALYSDRSDSRSSAFVQETAVPPERIDMLVASLAKKYREGNFANVHKDRDEWSSNPLAMVMMDVVYAGEGGAADTEMLLRLLPLTLKEEPRVNIVERDIMEKLLEELNLSTSDLADPMTSLKLGKILSARIIVTGSIIPIKSGLMVILRCIDTETTAVRKVLSVETSAAELDTEIIKTLGMKIVEWIDSDFPLKGRIISASGDKYQVDLGSVHGLKTGDRLEILSTRSEGNDDVTVIGEAELTEVGREKSWISIKTGEAQIKEGYLVREKAGSDDV